MNCEMFRDRVFDFLQGTRQASADFEAHRGSCPACAQALAGIRENDRILGAARLPTAPPDLWPRIAAAIAQDRVLPYGRLRLASFVATAAALLLTFALFATSRPPAAPRINLVVQDVGPESQRAFRSLMPRYEDVDAGTAMVDTMFRSDY